MTRSVNLADALTILDQVRGAGWPARLHGNKFGYRVVVRSEILYGGRELLHSEAEVNRFLDRYGWIEQ